MYLPGLHAEGMGEIVVAIDTSGSIDDTLVSQFGGELAGIIEDMAPERVTVLYADSSVQRVETFEKLEPFELHPMGGGGTDFRPVFKHVETMEPAPVCVVYLTDLWGTFPATDPGIPVLWATPENPATLPERYRPPWGEIVEIR
jgi:predicted metal-dependent peptidase